ncbi:hypothetical protein TI39_contig621g00002 [Zymoseptoria brevis]|uniref:Uncharacterized protein n=1 Tax=Zymoseptoria brevis TaxID=1047168 RepID=A0A0F4GHK3_9PEZI|nr:hypothetical protein TI39_contig621g00002 [Zymoseptoria brevis]
MSDSDEDTTAEPAKKKPKVLDSTSNPPKTPKKRTAPVASGKNAAPTTELDVSRALWDQFIRGGAELDLGSSDTMRLLLLGAKHLGLPYGEATEDLLRKAYEEAVLGRKTLGTLRIVDTDAWRMAIAESTREQSPAKLNLSNQQLSGSAFTPVTPGKAPAATPFTPANQNAEMEVQTPKTLEEARAFKKTHKRGTNDSPSVKVAHRAAEKLITESLKIKI